MRDYQAEFDARVAYIRNKLSEAHADGIVFGNSGGKDSALVGILCKAACDNTVGVIMPCSSKRNYGEDAEDGRALAEQFGIETRVVDLTPVREAELKALDGVAALNDMALTNIAPRLRMTTLYAIGAALALILTFLKVPALPVALGMFIPLQLNMPLLVGGAINWYVTTRSKDKAVNEARGERGTLIASGFIAGGALMGVISALMRFGNLNFVSESWMMNPLSEVVALIAYVLLILYFIRATKVK